MLIRSHRRSSISAMVIIIVLIQSFLLVIGGCKSEPAQNIVFTSERDGNAEIYIVDPDGSKVLRLTDHPRMDANPVLSPDGRKIAFRSNRDGFDNIYTMDIDGNNVMRLTNGSATDYFPEWSPDGTRILFTSCRDSVVPGPTNNEVNIT